MRKRISLLVVILISNVIISCQNKKSNDGKDHYSNLEKERIEYAKTLSNKILTAQKNGGFYNLSEKEASLKMINGLNESLQKASYKQIKSIFGDYKSLEFESLVQTKYKVYRFKGNFESNSNVEIRTVLNSKGKLEGFFIKPWKAAL